MAKKTVTRRTKKSTAPVSKYDELPATQKMIHNLEKMIKSEVKSLEKKMDSKFSQIDSKFNLMDSKFSQIDSKFNLMDSKFSQIDSKLEKVLSEVHRMAIMMEEQNSRNKFVLDGYEQLYKRQDRLEFDVSRRLQNIETIIAESKKELP